MNRRFNSEACGAGALKDGVDELNSVLLAKSSSENASADRHADVAATRAALMTWMQAVSPLKERLKEPTQLTHVIYGHTHVWDRYQFPGTAVISWNLNTWLVEPDHPFPKTGFLGIDANGAADWVPVG